MGWIGNILLLYSWYGIGRKWRHAIMVGAIGSGFWAVKAFDASMWDNATMPLEEDAGWGIPPIGPYCGPATNPFTQGLMRIPLFPWPLPV